jgi:threonine dehydrogenase-like Zn-dependent dehydrogenase
MPAPRPADGQLVLAVHSCGICGSDLHAKDHGDELADVLDEVGGGKTPKTFKVGTRVVSSETHAKILIDPRSAATAP